MVRMTARPQLTAPVLSATMAATAENDTFYGVWNLKHRWRTESRTKLNPPHAPPA
jgi:hypothetical protein